MKQKGGYINDTFIELIQPNPRLEELRAQIVKLRSGIKEEYITYLDSYMSLGVFSDYIQKLNITNYILVNKQDYILIDEKKRDGNTDVFVLEDNYTIKEYNVIKELLPEFYNKNINILGLTSDIIYSRILYSERLFFKLAIGSYIRKENFPYYFKILDIFYTSGGYNNNMNLILSFIFMNKLHELLQIINTLEESVKLDTTNYYTLTHDDQQKNKLKQNLFSDFTSSNICDSLLIYANVSDDKANIISIDTINYNLKQIVSRESVRDLNPENYNLLLKIINIVIEYVSKNDNLISSYNYSIYLYLYKKLIRIPQKNKDESEANYTIRKDGEYKQRKKDMDRFIDNKHFKKIKQKLVFELSYFIYLSYKTNEESGDFNIKLVQNTLIDYFYGVTKDDIPYLPINPRQTLINIRGGPDDNTSYVIPETLILNEEDEEVPIDKLFYNYYFSSSHYIPLPITQILIYQSRIYQENDRGVYNYPDCGETTLLNFFNYLLVNEDGSFNSSILREPKIKKFYQKYPTIYSILNEIDKTLKTEWGIVMENHPQIIDKEMYSDKTYNFKPSIENCTFICNLFCGSVDKSLTEIITHLNSKIIIKDIKYSNESPYEVVKINNELKLIFAIFHAESYGITKINKIYNVLEERLQKKLIINYPYTDINIHLLIKVANGNFDEKECGNYNVIKYLIKNYFTHDSIRLNNQTKFNLLKYLIFDNTNIVDDHLDITDESILLFIFNQVTTNNNIENIFEFLDESTKYLNENMINKLLLNPIYSQIAYNLRYYPLNLLKQLYEYRIDENRFVEFSGDDINDDTSYIIIYFNNKIIVNNSNISVKIKDIITILENSEYKQRINNRNSNTSEDNKYKINEYDKAYIYNKEDDIGYYENEDSILHIIDNAVMSKLHLISILSYELDELTDNNTKIERNILNIKSILKNRIFPMYSYINDELIEERRRANEIEEKRIIEYKLTAPTRALEYKTESHGILELITVKIQPINELISSANAEYEEINRQEESSEELKAQSLNALTLVKEYNESINTIMSQMRDTLTQIDQLYIEISTSADIDVNDKNAIEINRLLYLIKSKKESIDSFIKIITEQSLIVRKRSVIQKNLWDSYDLSFLIGGYYNKSKKYYNKLSYSVMSNTIS